MQKNRSDIQTARTRTVPATLSSSSQTSTTTSRSAPPSALLPLGAVLLAGSLGSLGSLGAMAQTSPATPAPPPAASQTLKPVVVKEKAETPEGKDSVRATNTSIGKGNQELRNIPQSITVVTEKLIDDRNLDTVKDALRNTAGVTFQAAEGGEEDIRLRGFSLATTGDIFIDGMRDPAFYDRDTFNIDRLELLRGSASMLFGRGSTGGAVNQASKVPRLITEHEVTTTLGSHNYVRVLGDFNIKTGESAALRINTMITKADNNGSGTRLDKKGIAAAYRFGIGEKDEFQASLYYLENKNGINYGLPWVRPNAAATTAANTLMTGLDPSAYYGMASDRNNGSAQWLAFKHTHRFSADSELTTQVRSGRFTRDQRASTIRFMGTTAAAATPLTNPAAVTLDNLNANTVLNRGAALKIQDVDALHFQSDFSAKFAALGFKHEVVTGIDFANEKKFVNVVRTAAQGGVDITKAQTFYGTPSDGASVNEDARILRPGNDFSALGVGIYAQDLIQVAQDWKVLLGLRYDNMRGNYSAYTIPTATPLGALVTTSYAQNISAPSKRLGVLYQPNALHSYHFSYGTSFNTSGDVYSYNAQSANTDPESSVNIEFGAKLDSADKQFTTRLALFHSTKNNERNTDPDTAATRLLLSGQRHSAGFEVDVTGRINKQWEVYGSYMWMPEAVVDIAASTSTTVGNRAGDRPGLSPVHSGTVWSTYQYTPKFRFGGGVNFRSAQAPADTTAPAWEAPGFATIDLMAEYMIDERFTVKANLNNIGNVLYGDSLYRGHYVPGTGRLLYVSLSAKF